MDINVNFFLRASVPVSKTNNGFAAMLAAQAGMEEVMSQNNRIDGGKPTVISQFPWIVSMQRFGAHRCGASIISATRLVSAAHCTFLIAACSLQINAGSTYSQINGQFIQVASFINHPSFNFFTVNNDINVMTLVSSLFFSGVVASIGLPKSMGWCCNWCVCFSCWLGCTLGRWRFTS